MAHGRRLFSDDVDLVAIGEQFRAKQRKGVTDAMEARRDLPTDRFLDVHYADLMDDPMKQVRRIYDFLGYRLEDATVESMAAFRSRNPKDKRGRHRYGPGDFGLTRRQLDEDFAAYREHHVAARCGQRLGDGAPVAVRRAGDQAASSRHVVSGHWIPQSSRAMP